MTGRRSPALQEAGRKVSLHSLVTRGLSPKQFLPELWRQNKPGRVPFGRNLVFLLGFNALLLLWLILKPAGEKTVAAVDNLLGTVGPLLAAGWCAAALLRRARTDPAGRLGCARCLSVLLLGLGVLAFAIGEAIWTYYEVALHRQTPFPSWADVAYVAAYPLLLGGVLLLPRRPIPPAVRWRVLIDSLVMLTALVTFSWYFVLGPVLHQGSETLLGKILGAGYPVGDLMLLSCLLLLGARMGREPRGGVIGLAIGLALVIGADTAFGYLTLHNAYHTGMLLDIGWSLGYMLIGWGAAVALSATEAAEPECDKTDSPDVSELQYAPVWRSLVPYAFVPAVAGLDLYTHIAAGDESLERGVFAGSGLLIALVLARQVLTILENNRLNRRLAEAYSALQAHNRHLEAMVNTDGMTGLANHRTFQETLRAAVSESAESGRPVALLMADIDYFKRYNDSYGHPAGDVVLKTVASILHAAVDAGGCVARYGGEEFAVVLPDTSEREAYAIAEELRQAVAAYPFPNTRVTLSMGLAVGAGTQRSADELLSTADRALYTAKYAGRNRVAVWDAEAGRAAGRPAGQEMESGAIPFRGERRFLKAVLRGPEGEIVTGLLGALDLRDRADAGHARRVAVYSLRLAQEAALQGLISMNRAELNDLVLSSLLHDLGKIGVPDNVLQKPGALTEEEWAHIQRLPGEGASLMEKFTPLGGAQPAVRHHHERWDGAGYPGRLHGKEIPVAARIAAIAEAFDAMSCDRPYRDRMAYPAIRAEIEQMAGAQFDPDLVRAFLDIPESEWSRLEREVHLDLPAAPLAELPKAA